MNMIFEKVLSVIEKCEDLNPKVNLKEIRQEMEFKADLGFDSLALMSLVYELQEAYPELDEMAIADWSTIDDCVKHLERLKR